MEKRNITTICMAGIVRKVRGNIAARYLRRAKRRASLKLPALDIKLGKDMVATTDKMIKELNKTRRELLNGKTGHLTPGQTKEYLEEIARDIEHVKKYRAEKNRELLKNKDWVARTIEEREKMIMRARRIRGKK